MGLELRTQEVEVLRWLVERQLPQLRFELARTEDPEFRTFIHRRIDELEELDLKLGQEQDRAAAPPV